MLEERKCDNVSIEGDKDLKPRAVASSISASWDQVMELLSNM